MKFGFVHFCRDLGLVGTVARLAEQRGFDLMGLCDSPALAYDPFVGLAIAATDSRQLRLGTGVTNPQTRHPLILANLAAALEDVAPGRSFLGLGIGNSGVHHVGAQPARLSELAATVETIRKLVRGDTVTSAGTELRVKTPGRDVPIVIAGSGPRSLRQAGAIADGVWINVGADPALVAEAMGWVHEGAESASRDPKTLEISVFAIAAISGDGARALDEVKAATLAVAKYVLKADAAAGRLPDWLAAKMDRFVRGYAYQEHLSPGHSTNYALADELEIGDYLLNRFAIAGTADDCAHRLSELEQLAPDAVVFSFSAAPDILSYVNDFGTAVLPRFSQPDSAPAT